MGQHRGKGLGRPIGHRYRKDSLGVPTTCWARCRCGGRAHRHPLLETAAVAAAILIGGHVTLQGCNGRRCRDRKLVLCRRTLSVKGRQTSPVGVATQVQQTCAYSILVTSVRPQGRRPSGRPARLASVPTAGRGDGRTDHGAAEIGRNFGDARRAHARHRQRRWPGLGYLTRRHLSLTAGWPPTPSSRPRPQ